MTKEINDTASLVRLPQALFADEGILINGVKLSEERLTTVRIGRFKLTWHFTGGLTARHMRLLLALLMNSKEATEKENCFEFVENEYADPRLREAAREDIRLWDKMQDKTAVWVGTGSELLRLARMDPTDRHGRDALNELVFAANGLDIKVSIVGGAIKNCRPVSIFKSATKTDDGLLRVKLNWFFAQCMFADFKEVPEGGSGVIKYTSINYDFFDTWRDRPLRQLMVIWLSFLTNSFLSPLEISWERFEELMYGSVKERSRRQIRDNIRYIRSHLLDLLVNFPTAILSCDDIDKYVNGSSLVLPILRVKREPTPLVDQSPGSEGFEKFWSLYPATPRKNAKSFCKRLWVDQKLEPLTEVIIDAIRQRRQSVDWAGPKKDERIPAPSNWLKRREWEH